MWLVEGDQQYLEYLIHEHQFNLLRKIPLALQRTTQSSEILHNFLH